MKLTKRQKQIASYSLLLLGVIAVASIAWSILFAGRIKIDEKQAAMTSKTMVALDAMPGRAKQTLPAEVLKLSDSYDRVVVHTGTIESRKRTMVAFQRAGMLTELLADEGESVSPNALLAVMDNRQLLGQQASLQANLKQANAVLAELKKGPRDEAIASAQNVVEDLQQQLKAQELRATRSRDLVQSRSIAKQDYERELYAKRGLEARLKSAESQLEQLVSGTREEQLLAQEATVQGIEAELQIVQYNLDDCQLKAPFRGMIIARFTDPGSVVSPGSPIFELIDHKNLEIHVGIPPHVSESLAIGNRFDVMIGKHKLQGVLRTVLPTIDPATRTCKAILDVEVGKGFENPNLFVGQLAKVQLTERVNEAGYWIPMNALSADHSGLWSCLAVDPDLMDGDQGIAKKHSVEILFQRDQQAFVRGTLRPGSLLIRSGVHRIVAGQYVAISLDSADRNSFRGDAITSRYAPETRRIPLQSRSPDQPAAAEPR